MLSLYSGKNSMMGCVKLSITFSSIAIPTNKEITVFVTDLTLNASFSVDP